MAGALVAVLLACFGLWGLKLGEAWRGSMDFGSTGTWLGGVLTPDPTVAQGPEAAAPARADARALTGAAPEQSSPNAVPDRGLPADSSSVAAQVLPRPIPLARHARDPQGASRQAAIDADPGSDGMQVDAGASPEHLSFRDALGRKGSAEIGQVQVSEAELGMPFLPGSQVSAQESARIRDPASGSQLTVALRSPVPVAEAVAFYRAQLARQARPGDAVVQVQHPAPDQTLITRTHLLSGAQQAALISPEGTGVLVRLVHKLPPSAATTTPKPSR